VRPYIQKAAVCIAPLVSGAGLRGKVIEYAALRRPFVATSIAVEDLVFQDGRDFLRADAAQDFSQRIIGLLRDPERAREMAASAYETARSNYDTPRLVEFLERFYSYLEFRS
jgi:glycosyltransferase involved in cell wall biosynthesis